MFKFQISSPESKRKTVHLIMGVFCLTLPWIFSKSWPVDLLALISLVILFAIRNFKPALGQILHSVERLSFGELLFPVGVTIVFRLADGDLSLYLPAIAILTFADAAGALIGKRYGKHLYRTNAGQKSLEGSLAVFLVSFFIILFAGISDDPLTAFLIALVVALVASMAEGILAAGIDNLILPLTVAGLIYFLRELTWNELVLRLILFSGSGLFLFIIRRLTSLNGGGLLSATLFAYLSFALGGPHFLIAPVLLLFIHLLTNWRYPELSQMEHSADCISAIALPALFWVVLKTNSGLPDETCFHGFTLTLMAQAAFLHSATRKHLDLANGLFIGALKISALALTSYQWWFTPIALVILIASLPFTRNLKRPEQAVLACLFSTLALLP